MGKVCIMKYNMKFELMGLEKSDINRLHERAMSVLESSQIKEESFIEPYGEETVKRDLETVRQKEAKFETNKDAHLAELKEIADIFEAIVLENGELNNWFGENAVTIKTSKYDDYENGVDAVIEFRVEEPRSASFLGLAADVTFSSDTTKKFNRLEAQIAKGILPRVKYFHSEYAHIHGQLSMVPEVIIGASKKTVMEVAELWANRENKELAKHRLQIMILHQMEEQLKTFSKYAASLGKDKMDIADAYTSRLGIIQKILDEKIDIEKKAGWTMIDDPVHSGIMNHLAKLNQTIQESPKKSA